MSTQLTDNQMAVLFGSNWKMLTTVDVGPDGGLAGQAFARSDISGNFSFVYTQLYLDLTISIPNPETST